MPPINGWLNIYKPVGISSAGLVGKVKKILGKVKIGHTGTLDVEAEGVLPLAIGEATKLVQFLIEAKKAYRFKVQFGACTDTGDKAGKILKTTDYIPTRTESEAVCEKFIGIITQTPPAFSALKISGVPAYKLARAGKEVNLKPRNIEIFSLKMESYEEKEKTAIYYAECSKGTYIRTLAEDISLSLQTLGFVLELARTRVGTFTAENALKPSELIDLSAETILGCLQKIEVVLADILVFDIDVDIALKVRHGKKITIPYEDTEQIWLRANNKILAIGSIRNGYFNSARVLNLE
jgi:tRNA pseudouridine55 synthase